jgi:hypothetical protein
MTDDQNLTQNQTPEENTSPMSLQESMADAPIPVTDSATPEVLSVPPEAPRDDFEVKSNDIPPSDSTITKSENTPTHEASTDAEILVDKPGGQSEQKTEEKQA